MGAFGCKTELNVEKRKTWSIALLAKTLVEVLLSAHARRFHTFLDIKKETLTILHRQSNTRVWKLLLELWTIAYYSSLPKLCKRPNERKWKVKVKSLSRVWLCILVDCSPPGSPIPGILQARMMEWVAISFSNEWKRIVKVKSLSRVWLCNAMDCSLPGSSIHGIFQARVLEWGAILWNLF